MTTESSDIFAEIQAMLVDTRGNTPDLPAGRISSAIALYREGLAIESELLEYLTQLGADPLQRDRLLLSAQLDRRREVAKALHTVLVLMFRTEVISLDQLRLALVRAGYTPEGAGLIELVESYRSGVTITGLHAIDPLLAPVPGPTTATPTS